jgi:small nuclear ribonucleoprotein (snRNP)-like protein
MKYTLKDLFDFMESGRPVKVTCKDGKIFQGRCWAYSSVQNMEEDDIDEPSLEVQDTILYLSEIQTIEYLE